MNITNLGVPEILTISILVIMSAIFILKNKRYDREEARLKSRQEEVNFNVFGPFGNDAFNPNRVVLYFTSSHDCEIAFNFLESMDKQFSNFSRIEIHEHRMYQLDVEGDSIDKGLLWLLKVPKLSLIQYDISTVETIMNKHFVNYDIFVCQQELIDARLEKWANL